MNWAFYNYGGSRAIEYIKGVIARLLILLLLFISIPTGIVIIVLGFLFGFIFGFDEIIEDNFEVIMMWPFNVVDKLFGKKYI